MDETSASSNSRQQDEDEQVGIVKSSKHICFTFHRNVLKYVIKRIGDQSDDKGDENDVERNDEENKYVEEFRQEESFSSRLIKAVFCLM